MIRRWLTDYNDDLMLSLFLAFLLWYKLYAFYRRLLDVFNN